MRQYVKAKIYNQSNELENVFEGYIENATFYKNPSKFDKLAGLFGSKTQQTINNINYSQHFTEGKQKVIQIRINENGEYSQISLTKDSTTGNNDAVQRYLTIKELAEAKREPLLRKSNNIMLIGTILWLIFMGITAVIFENTITSATTAMKTTANTIIAPYTSQIAQNTYLLHTLQNQTAHLEQIYNATLAKLSAP